MLCFKRAYVIFYVFKLQCTMHFLCKQMPGYFTNDGGSDRTNKKCFLNGRYFVSSLHFKMVGMTKIENIASKIKQNISVLGFRSITVYPFEYR